MVKKTLDRPWEIECKELQSYHQSVQNNHFFELICIMEGTGTQTVNKNQFEYRKGNLFLLTPQDTYSFNISTPTHFFFLRFNEYYVRDYLTNDKEAAKRVEYILQNASHRPGCILKNAADKPLVASLVTCVCNEQINQQIYHHHITGQLINTLITVVARNIALKLPKNINENTGELILEILGYIQQNIFEPRKLRTEIMSNHFHISIHHFGRYFKTQTGNTLQNYIASYKLKMIEQRLLFTNMRMNEITHEFGFSDESHLNRTFKKYKGVNPSVFRKLNRIVPDLSLR